MEKRILSLTAATILSMVSFTFALETDAPDPTNSQDKATEVVVNFLNDVHRSDNAHLVRTSLFRPYASGTHHYLIAKAFVTFYNHETQRTIGILVDMDANWTFELSEEQLDYFVRTGDRSHLPQPPDLDPLAADKPGYQPRPQPVVAPPTPVPPVVQPTPQPEPTYVNERQFIENICGSLDHHDWTYITRFTVGGRVNYFGHRLASNDFIVRDMRGDARNYAWVKSVTYPDSFTHEVDGGMVYDSITQYSEAMENNGRMHRATVRLTVGYTVENGMPSVYALVLKVI